MTRIHVGCGTDLRAGHVNVDVRDDCGADVVADAADLPFPDASASELLALDVLEHTPYPLRFLAEWHRVLAPDGVLTLRVPNMQGLAAQMVYWSDKPGPVWDGLVRNVYGGHEFGPDGCYDAHHTGWSPASLTVTLDQAGFDVLSISDELNMVVTARRRP